MELNYSLLFKSQYTKVILHPYALYACNNSNNNEYLKGWS